jgi:hypothetical protein
MNADSTELQNFSEFTEFNKLKNLRHIQFQTTATKSRAETQSLFDEKLPSSHLFLCVSATPRDTIFSFPKDFAP